MPLYQYVCDECAYTEEKMASVKNRGMWEQQCVKCTRGTMRRTIGNLGGFRLGRNGSVGWADDGYAATLGDSHKFKTGQKV